ncbi:MAG TPA: prepilin-type N-terminal cleavage/methylation domain-containing protein [Nitrospiraceae bacterium]|nr:prepilin-type N-terminal cleavage/methylation domain-containing protein [Nitrospiraceae bacterium]
MKERGFTLLEVMLALAILAIALPVLLGLRNRDVELLGYAHNLTIATLLAQEKLLETEIMGFPPTGEQSGDFQNPSPGTTTSEPAQARPREFRWTRTVVPTPLDVVREVRIKIIWPRGLSEETLEVTSYVFLEPRVPS